MSRLISVAILAGVLAILSGPGAARAESQAGGLPAVSARVSALEQVAAALQAQVTVLQTANTGLQNALNAEIAARTAAEAALQKTLADETAARNAAESILTSSIITERANRISADNALASQIGASGAKAFSTVVPVAFIPNGVNTNVAQLALPPGNYFVFAHSDIHNQFHDIFWLCMLLRNDGAELDSTFANTDGQGTFDEFVINQGAVTLAAVTTVGASGHVRLECSNGGDDPGSRMEKIKLFAISVGL